MEQTQSLQWIQSHGLTERENKCDLFCNDMDIYPKKHTVPQSDQTCVMKNNEITKTFEVKKTQLDSSPFNTKLP